LTRFAGQVISFHVNQHTQKIEKSTMKKLSACMMALALSASAAVGRADTPKAGDKAPEFEAKDQDGKMWKLSGLAAKQVVLLYFYPKDDTPGCTKEACGLRDRMSDLKKDNVQVLGVSFDDGESHKKFIAKHNLNFPLLVDTDGKIADKYGARMPNKSMARRVSFLIGLDGKIAHVTDNPSADVQLNAMKDAVAKLAKK